MQESHVCHAVCRENGPNLEQIRTKCQRGETLSKETCIPFCTKESGKSCIQMTYTRRDKEKSIIYQTHFCGEGIDLTNNGKTIRKGCHKQTNLDEYDVEACFCQGHECNGGSVPQAHLLLAMFTFLSVRMSLCSGSVP